MISVTLIGSGNVAYHLAHHFLKRSQICLKQIYTRNTKDLRYWKDKVSTTNSLELLEESDVTILAVSDDSIQEVSKHVKNSFVVHTSGGKSVNELKNTTNKGVFYPLQTFSKHKEVSLSEVPFCLEAENNKDLQLLKRIVKSLDSNWFEINSEQRKHLHVAAVFANNFSNHMYTLAKDICQKHNVPFQILFPLIQETSQKIVDLSPEKSQTGPAVRNDKKTIEKHVNLLSEKQKEIYKLITESIQNHGKKL